MVKERSCHGTCKSASYTSPPVRDWHAHAQFAPRTWLQCRGQKGKLPGGSRLQALLGRARVGHRSRPELHCPRERTSPWTLPATFCVLRGRLCVGRWQQRHLGLFRGTRRGRPPRRRGAEACAGSEAGSAPSVLGVGLCVGQEVWQRRLVSSSSWRIGADLRTARAEAPGGVAFNHVCLRWPDLRVAWARAALGR